MFKKLLIASAVLAVSSTVAFAGHASYKGEYKGEPPCPTHNFMAGPYIGLSIGSRTNYTGTPAVFSGLDGNLSLGYGMFVAPAFYLAGELFGLGTINLKDMPNNQTGTAQSVKSNWGWGGSVIPGYLLTENFLGFIRVGGQQVRFNGQGQTVGGWHVGVGGQTNIYQNWDLRGEFVYSRFSSVSGIGIPNSNVTSVGVVYKFV